MTYSPRVVLADILTHLGKAALDDAKRFEALLKDLCPDRRSDVQVLALALRHGLVRQILQGRSDVPPQLLRSRFADGLHR